MKAYRIKATRQDLYLKAINYALLIIIAFSMIFPFWEIIAKSFMTDADIIRSQFALWPKNFQFEGYKAIFTDKTYNFVRAFANSVFVTIADTIYQLLITALAAYALTKKTLPGRKFFMLYMVFTMYFGGGLIPYYMLIRSLNLIDSIFVLIIPSFISIFNLLVMKTFFQELPQDIFDAATVDGSGDIRTFATIVLPLSKAVLATIALFIAVGVWNNWFTTMLFIQSPQKRTIAYALQIIIEKSRGTNTDIGSGVGQVIIGQSVQYAAIVVAVFPIMAVYPFLQKHFTKGVMIGSIKG